MMAERRLASHFERLVDTFCRDFTRDEVIKAIEAGNPDAAARAARECARWARRIHHAD
jgi:hypothetical protein